MLSWRKLKYFFVISENLQSVFDNTISEKDNSHKHISNIKTIHGAQDDGNHRAM